MPTSPYLESSLARWSDRGVLVRRDVELLLEGLQLKGHLLNGLRDRISQHRSEDMAQFEESRREAQTQWEERLKRLEEWIGTQAGFRQSTEKLKTWSTAAQWFDNAQTIAVRYRTSTLEPKMEKLENRLVDLTEGLIRWSERLLEKETELHTFMDRETNKGVEIFVSSARKRPYLDFVYAEREEEGRLSREIKLLRLGTQNILARFARADRWASDKVRSNPAQFEVRKTQLLNMWRSFQTRSQALQNEMPIRETAFDEGRRRLRWIYESIQRMRVLDDVVVPPKRKPLLYRLFNINDD